MDRRTRNERTMDRLVNKCAIVTGAGGGIGAAIAATFASEGGFMPPAGNNDFGAPVLTDGNLTMTVSNSNAELRFTQLEYGLKFDDGSTLDPRMINR